jgi:hypothetical protein
MGLFDGVATDAEQRLLHELARATQIAADGGDENLGRMAGHGHSLVA